MATIDPTAAMLDALVASLATTLGSGYTVRRGWPEHGQLLDLSEPLIAVTAGQPDDELRSPEANAWTDNGDGTVESLYAYGRRGIDVQVDLWAAYRAVRDTAAVAVLKALRGDRFPQVAGLNLALTKYHGIRAQFDLAPGGGTDDDPDGGARGEWRQTFAVRAECELVDEVTETAVTEAVIDLDVDDGDDWAISEEFPVTP
jgi:hypothetical protein